jgi:hypothetical protein
MMRKYKKIFLLPLCVIFIVLVILVVLVFLKAVPFDNAREYLKNISVQNGLPYNTIKTIDKYGNESQCRVYTETEIIGDGQEVKVIKKVIEPQEKFQYLKDRDGNFKKVRYFKEVIIDEKGFENERWILEDNPEMLSYIYEGQIDRYEDGRLYFIVQAKSELLYFENHSYTPIKIDDQIKVFDFNTYDLEGVWQDRILYEDSIFVEDVKVEKIEEIKKILEEKDLYGKYVYIQDSTHAVFENAPTSKIFSIRDFIFEDAKN